MFSNNKFVRQLVIDEIGIFMYASTNFGLSEPTICLLSNPDHSASKLKNGQLS